MHLAITLTCLKYKHNAWFLDGRTSTFVFLLFIRHATLPKQLLYCISCLLVHVEQGTAEHYYYFLSTLRVYLSVFVFESKYTYTANHTVTTCTT